MQVFFLHFKKYYGLSVTGDDHCSWWSYFRFTNDYNNIYNNENNSVESRSKKLTRF